MKHDLEHLTDGDIAAALDSLYVPGDHKERLHKEVARRAKIPTGTLSGAHLRMAWKNATRADIGFISIGLIPARNKRATYYHATAANLGCAPRTTALKTKMKTRQRHDP